MSEPKWLLLYHNNLIYRAAIVGLMLCGCIGRNGGGLNHYVGQEKLAPVAPWGTLAFALDWVKPPRLQNAPSFHYVHSDKWRYDENLVEAQPGFHQTQGHTMDLQVRGAGGEHQLPHGHHRPLLRYRSANGHVLRK